MVLVKAPIVQGPIFKHPMAAGPRVAALALVSYSTF